MTGVQTCALPIFPLCHQSPICSNRCNNLFPFAFHGLGMFNDLLFNPRAYCFVVDSPFPSPTFLRFLVNQRNHFIDGSLMRDDEVAQFMSLG